MKVIMRYFVCMLCACAALPGAVLAQTVAEPQTEQSRSKSLPAPSQITNTEDNKDAFPNSIWSMVHLETQWFLHYHGGERLETQDDGTSALSEYNRFNISRGYLTFKLKPAKWLEPRITVDTHQDEVGDWKIRLKYLYGKFNLPVESTVFTEPYVEFGLVHTPWFDYEEHINYFRMQGSMFIERNGTMNSADLGVTVGGLLGRKLDDAYRHEVNKKYPGTWGSYAFGVYNGGGYHASETNKSKVFEGRLSLRPLGSFFPNWQVTYFGTLGKGNTNTEPDWHMNVFFTSYEHRFFVLTGQYAFGTGNQKGSKVVDEDGSGAIEAGENESIDFKGPSVFAEVRLPWIRSSLVGRFDYWEWDGSKPIMRVIGGYAFHILGERKNVVLVDYDRVMQEGVDDTWELKLTLQVAL